MRPPFSLSLDTLLTLPDAIAVDQHSVIVDNTFTKHVTLLTDEWRDYPVKLDAVMIMFCTSGEIEVKISFERYIISENSVCVVTPGAILEIMDVKPDFHCIMLAFKKDFFDLELATTQELMQVFKYIQQMPSVKLSGNYASRCRDTFSEIIKAASWTENPLRNRMVQSYISILFFCLYPVFTKEELHFNRYHGASNQNRIYLRFIDLLQSNYIKYRTVAYYAEKLDLTPKYLSKVIQKESGQSARTWIDNYVILEAKALLIQNNDSILSISRKMNFPNQGSFGKFFRRVTGMSPKEYRDIKITKNISR